MYSVLKRWLGQDDVADAGVDSAPASPMRRRPNDYLPDLIDSLQTEHRELLSLFGEIECASERGDTGECRATLDRFTRILQDHLLTENRHLYDWFARHPDTNSDIAQHVERMSADMMHVGKILDRFITTYTRAPWTPELQSLFARDIRVIGEVLAHRIHEEEKVLYPLYQPRAS